MYRVWNILSMFTFLVKFYMQRKAKFKHIINALNTDLHLGLSVSWGTFCLCIAEPSAYASHEAETERKHEADRPQPPLHLSLGPLMCSQGFQCPLLVLSCPAVRVCAGSHWGPLTVTLAINTLLSILRIFSCRCHIFLVLSLVMVTQLFLDSS